MRFFSVIRRVVSHPLWLNQLDKILSIFACAVAIFMTAWLTASQLSQGPILLASMGASAAILFAIHGSPLAQPWSLLGGHLSSGLVGVLLAYAIDQPWLAAALTAGLSVLAMMLLRCLHPPGVATALIPVLNYPHGDRPNFEFLLTPLALNVTALLLLTLLINRLLLRRNYPSAFAKVGPHTPPQSPASNLISVERGEIERAMRDFGQFVDVGVDDLRQLFGRLQLQRIQARHPNITCGDIMQGNAATLEYATEVETAWVLMHQKQLKILPVLDRARRVIGIVTLSDFLKQLELSPYADFQEKWRSFIRRTPSPNTNKPEAVGHIMSRKVNTVASDAHICELIPLLLEQGFRHVPIVDHEQRFVGLVGQRELIAALIDRQSPATAVSADD